MSYPLWLRCERKAFERRSALSPSTCKKLIAGGYFISVERDEQRIFDDKEYEGYVKMSLRLSPQLTKKLAWAARLSQTTAGLPRPLQLP